MSITPPCSPTSPTTSPPRRKAATCWRARCWPRASARARRRWCVTPGATRTAAKASKPKCSTCSATCSPARTTGCAWRSASIDDDTAAGMREGHRLGGVELAIARARTGVIKRLNSAKHLLDAVPVSARQDPGYIFAKAHWLRRHDKPDEAARLLLTAPQNAAALIDTNQWWLELRVLVRQLLDKHKPRTAYRVARDAARPDAGQLAGRQIFHRRLDRLALPARCQDRRRGISPISRKARPTPTRSRAPAIGRGARPRPWASTRSADILPQARRQIHRSPITASLRARGSASRTSAWIGPPKFHRAGARGAAQSRNRARRQDPLRARRTQHARVDL